MSLLYYDFEHHASTVVTVFSIGKWLLVVYAVAIDLMLFIAFALLSDSEEHVALLALLPIVVTFAVI